MTTIWPVSPWRRALREDRCLPASVLGPVECCELARLISVRDGVDMPWYSIGGLGEEAGGSGKWLKRGEFVDPLFCISAHVSIEDEL
jgi:hypothetical protein